EAGPAQIARARHTTWTPASRDGDPRAHQKAHLPPLTLKPDLSDVNVVLPPAGRSRRGARACPRADPASPRPGRRCACGRLHHSPLLTGPPGHRPGHTSVSSAVRYWGRASAVRGDPVVGEVARRGRRCAVAERRAAERLPPVRGRPVQIRA